MILINAQQQFWRVDGYFPGPHKYVTAAVGLGGEGWKILGWPMADGTMPLGEYDAVDPDLAQVDYLPVPNAPPPRDHSTPRRRGFMKNPNWQHADSQWTRRTRPSADLQREVDLRAFACNALRDKVERDDVESAATTHNPKHIKREPRFELVGQLGIVHCTLRLLGHKTSGLHCVDISN